MRKLAHRVFRYSLGSGAAVFFLTVGFAAYKHNQSLQHEHARLHDASAAVQQALREVERRISRLEDWKATSAKLRLFFPELTETDVATLHESETVLAPFQASPKTVVFERALSPEMLSQNLVSQNGPFNRYFSAPNAELQIDETLPVPELLIDQGDSLYPTVRMVGASPPKNAAFYFEFDTSKHFDSPNFWRHPALLPQTFPQNLTGRAGLGYNVFVSPMREVRNSPEVTFPFRVTAMALPLQWEDIDFSRLAKFSQLLGVGLSEQQTIVEVFAVNRQRVVYSDETTKRTPLDTFKAGLGECIHANELTGSILEMNGIRFRTVGGVNPTVRNAYPGAGHAAIEVLNGDGTWEYVDPYLDIYSPGVSAKNFSGHPVGGIVVFEIDRKKFKSAEFGSRVTLADLFKYRMYSDSGGRLPPAAMTQLIGAEEQYGRDWELRKLNADERLDIDRDLPRRLEIYVRGRYIVSSCSVGHEFCADPKARASRWAETTFVTRPIELLAATPAQTVRRGLP